MNRLKIRSFLVELQFEGEKIMIKMILLIVILMGVWEINEEIVVIPVMMKDRNKEKRVLRKMMIRKVRNLIILNRNEKKLVMMMVKGLKGQEMILKIILENLEMILWKI